jgi:3-deoxy-D-manno-octulosonic-acid transferase
MRQLLGVAGIKKFTVTGDTRFDRVAAVAGNNPSIPALERFAGGSLVLVAGSTWPADEALILPLLRSRKTPMKLILAPHEVDEERIGKLVKSIRHPVIRYSQLTGKNAARARVVVVDTMGHLSRIYRYGTFAYIGGGFGKGIHNILEAAAYGIPVIFGPNYKKFAEAVDLAALGGAFPVKNEKELKRTVESLATDEVHCRHAADAARIFVESNCGAAKRILDSIRNFGFLPAGLSPVNKA